MPNMPDPKTIVDSVADGVVEVAEGPARVATNVGQVATTFASEMRANMDNLKNSMPDDPSAILDCAVKGASQTVKAGLSMVEGVGKGIQDTFDGVKNQIRRVAG